MKKTILGGLVLICATPFFALASSSISLSPTSGYDGSTTASIITSTNTCGVYLFDPTGLDVGAGNWSFNNNAAAADANGPSHVWLTGCISMRALHLQINEIAVGSYTVLLTPLQVLWSPSIAHTLAATEATLTSYGSPYSTYSVAQYSLTENPYNQSLQRLIDNATTTFDNTTDPPLTDYVSWSATNFYDLFLGSGLALLFELRGWIAAVLIISALVYFAFSGVRNEMK